MGAILILSTQQINLVTIVKRIHKLNFVFEQFPKSCELARQV